MIQLQSSYIFLPNPYKKENEPPKKQDHVINIKIEDSFISCLKSSFPDAIGGIEPNSLFKSIYTYSINADKISCNVIFQINSVAKNYYLDVIVVGRSKSQAIKGL